MTKDILAGKYFNYNYIELKRANFCFFFFCSADCVLFLYFKLCVKSTTADAALKRILADECLHCKKQAE